MRIPHRIRYLWYLLAGVSSSPDIAPDKAWWEEDYRRGGLDRTEGDVELPRHLLVAALARHYGPGGAIMDIGCGTGALAAPLRESRGGAAFRYLGLDYSSLALERAAAREHDAPPGTIQFVEASFDEYQPSDTFDAIIFSECLYYSPDPVKTVRRFTGALTPGGIIIVSMWRRPGRRRLWRALDDALVEVSRSRVSVPRRPAWDIVVYSVA